MSSFYSCMSSFYQSTKGGSPVAPCLLGDNGSDDVTDHVDVFQLPTPALHLATSAKTKQRRKTNRRGERRRQKGQNGRNRNPADTEKIGQVLMDEEILDRNTRPRKEAFDSSKKMLALPMPSIRAVDINQYREPGHVGINPITLTAGAGMLMPGSWGAGREYSSSLGGHRPPRQRQQNKLIRSQSDTDLWKGQWQELAAAKADFNELRLRYAQAILDGDAVNSLSTKSHVTSLPLTMQRSAKSAALDVGRSQNNTSEGDWEDFADDEDSSKINRKELLHRKREKSVDFSVDAIIDSVIDSTKTKASLAKQRPASTGKRVQFDETAIETQRRHSKARKNQLMRS